MLYIAHRGLLYGPDPTREMENSPKQIESALDKGFDVEIDVWYMDGNWFLGHDGPKYEVEWDWLYKNSQYFWMHCKNVGAFVQLNENDDIKIFGNGMNFFWHTTDKYTFTSLGFAWIYPGQRVFPQGMWVLPENTTREPSNGWWDIEKLRRTKCKGYCSDYISELREYMA